MSAAARAAIAAAASTVPAVTCQPYPMPSTNPGSAFVALARTARSANGFGYMTTWAVFVTLPQDRVAAEKFIDTNATAVADALSAALVVTSITPTDLVLDGLGTVPVLVFEGARESE